jgi:hypothetical protein
MLASSSKLILMQVAVAVNSTENVIWGLQLHCRDDGQNKVAKCRMEFNCGLQRGN